MNVEERQLRIASALEQVAPACEFVVEAARSAGLDERAIHQCYLAVDEACTNIIEHGYGTDCTACFIDLVCRIESDRLTITILDDSPAFDPLAMPEPDPQLMVNERPPGGWGIFFIKKLMDDVAYSYDGSRNRLILTKKRTPRAATVVSLEPAGKITVSITQVSDKVWMIKASGRLDSLGAPHLEAAFDQLFEQGRANFILNGAELDYLSSAGIKVIVSAWQRAREQRGGIVLTALSPRILDLLKIVGLDLVLTLTETVEQARAALVGKKGR